MNLKQLTVAIVLLLVVGLTAWLQELVEIPETRSGRAAERHDPDYFIDRFVMTTMGRPRLTPVPVEVGVSCALSR